MELAAEPHGIGDSLMESLAYTWNFGDGTTGAGGETEHVYRYPGEYVVYVRGEYARHAAATRHEVTVLPTAFSLTTAPDGSIQIHNNAKYEVDLSGYRLVGEEAVTLPEHTILLPNSTITIPKATVGQGNTPAVLLDQSRAIAALSGTEVAPAEAVKPAPVKVAGQPAAVSATPAPVAATATPLPPNFSFVSSAPTSTAASTEPELPPQTASVIDSGTASSERTAYLGLIGILALAIASIFISRQKS